MKYNALLFVALAALLFLQSCSKEIGSKNSGPKLVLRFQFDSTQQRLNNIGQPAAMPAGHAGQSPLFHKMSAHYVELAPEAFMALGKGAILYRAAETTAGGANAIDFEKSAQAGHGETFLSIPLKDVPAGDYEWLRVSLAYQAFDVKYLIDTTIQNTPFKQEFAGTVASFIGFNNYIKTLNVGSQSMAVNDDKRQGFWAFATTLSWGGQTFPHLAYGEAPEGAVTVVNPLFATSPVPEGSCVVTAAFNPGKLRITSTETADVVIDVSLSVNKSWEWKEVVADGKWDPGKGEEIVDMGIRGMIPYIR